MPLVSVRERPSTSTPKIGLPADSVHSMPPIGERDAEPQERVEHVRLSDCDGRETEIKTRHLRVEL